MRGNADLVGRVLRRFRAVGVLTLVELMLLLECSRRTVQRYLRKWGCLTSFNGNGSHYALPCSARFDRHGLWQCGEARFSRHGNLVRTVVGVVRDSSAGLTAAELGTLLGVDAHSFISRFRAHPELHRERLQGRFVYFAADGVVREGQVAARHRLAEAVPNLVDSEAVAVLVALVKRPGSTCEELSERVRDGTPRATPAAICRFLGAHGLRQKGGLPESPPPAC